MKTVHTLVVSFAYLYVGSVLAIDCPTGWVGHDSSCYHLSHDKEPWMLAQMICQGFGGYLSEIGNQPEDSFLINAVKQSTGTHFWIGGDDLSVEGEWKWWHSKGDINYSNWFPGEPTNGGGNENCLSLATSNNIIKWNDAACLTAYNYICEKQAGETEIVG